MRETRSNFIAKKHTCSNVSLNSRKRFPSVWKILKFQFNIDITVYIEDGN